MGSLRLPTERSLLVEKSSMVQRSWKVCYFLRRVGKGGLKPSGADQGLANLKVTANREVGSSGCITVP